MNRFYGKVGYVNTTEKIVDGVHTGVFTDTVTEVNYRGDVVKNKRSRWYSSGNVNDNLRFDNSISIVADEYAYKNFAHIKYVIWMGTKWKVETADVERPRIILALGGEYNG